MSFRLLSLACLAAALALPAEACRPFGSYQFVEDAAGGLWFTEGDNNAVSRLAPDGSVTAHKLPTPNAEPSSLALDRTGKLWFVEMEGGRIGRLDRSGRITEFPTSDGHPGTIAVDARGDAWFTQMAGHEASTDPHAGHGSAMVAKVGRIDAAGKMHDYRLAEGWPTSIAFARGDDRAWVSVLVPGERPRGKLLRLDRVGRWTPVAAWENSCPGNLTLQANGRPAYSDHCRGVVGRVDGRGGLVEQALPAGTYIQQLAAAPDGSLWFSGDEKGRLGRVDRDGKLSYLERRADDQTMAVLVTRRGEVVFSEFYNYNINRLTRAGDYVEHLVNVDERKDVREVREGEVCYVRFAARIAAKAEMDEKRAAEVRSGRFKADGQGTEKLVEEKCLACHDARRLLLSRRSDWTPSIVRMHAYRDIRGAGALSPEDTARIVAYFNTHYGLSR